MRYTALRRHSDQKVMSREGDCRPQKAGVPAIFSHALCCQALRKPSAAPQITCMAPVPNPRKKIKENGPPRFESDSKMFSRSAKEKGGNDSAVFVSSPASAQTQGDKAKKRQELHHFLHRAISTAAAVLRPIHSRRPTVNF